MRDRQPRKWVRERGIPLAPARIGTTRTLCVGASVGTFTYYKSESVKPLKISDLQTENGGEGVPRGGDSIYILRANFSNLISWENLQSKRNKHEPPSNLESFQHLLNINPGNIDYVPLQAFPLSRKPPSIPIIYSTPPFKSCCPKFSNPAP